MTITEMTKRHVIARYVEPARQKGEELLRIRVGNVQKELGWTNRAPSVFSTLSSRPFQNEAGLELIEKSGGPASGGPSTTVEFVYRILPSSRESASRISNIPKGPGLMDLYGIGAEVFKQLGGGEEYLKRERDELRFPAEGYPHSGKSA
ncbi:MAG TPA: hypothetical protein VK574_13210 [Terracidiphilus sp.]|nr:hypothetical protein [Terracidiphilus sp.]